MSESLFNNTDAFSHVAVFKKVSSTGVFLINFISTYSKLLKNFIYARFPLIEGYDLGALKGAPFVEQFKAATLR